MVNSDSGNCERKYDHGAANELVARIRGVHQIDRAADDNEAIGRVVAHFWGHRIAGIGNIVRDQGGAVTV